MSRVALVLALLSVMPQAVHAAERERVLVPAVRAEQGVPQGTANLLLELIVADIHRSGQYEVLTATDLATLLGVERQKQLAGCNQGDSCLAEMGNALGAGLVLDATVGSIGAMRVLSLRLVDTRKAKVRARVTETVPDEDALVAAAHRLIAELLGLPPPEPAAKGGGGVRAGWFVLGGGGVAAIAGGVLGGLALSDYQAFKADPYNDALGDRAKSQAYAADALYATSIVAAGVGVVMLLLGGDSSSSAEASR